MFIPSPGFLKAVSRTGTLSRCAMVRGHSEPIPGFLKNTVRHERGHVKGWQGTVGVWPS